MSAQNPAYQTRAFPVLERGGQGLELTDPGMTLRDWFAGMALTRLTEDPAWGSPEYTARYAYALADAMLKERTKP